MKSEISAPDVHITAAGGVVYRLMDGATPPTPRVVLIRRNGFWDIPKGKRDAGESVPACAVREFAEETGSELPLIVSPLLVTRHQYEEAGLTILKTTWWYVMVLPTDKPFCPQTSENIETVDWIDLEEAISLVSFDNLREVLGAFAGWVQKKR
jgi:8-oxo-dGTP pyrophosphatase MutT (NUDIX family)